MSQPGNFPHSSDKMGREVPEHSDAMSFVKDNGHNFLSNDTTIIPTTDVQVRSVFVLTILGTRGSLPFQFILPRDFVVFDVTFREFLGNSFLCIYREFLGKPFTDTLKTIIKPFTVCFFTNSCKYTETC